MKRSLLAGAVYLLAIPYSFAAVVTSYWSNVSGGDFSTAANWNPAQVPGSNDYAVFDLGQSSPYTVTFTNNVSLDRLYVYTDKVIFDLQGFTNSVLGSLAAGTIRIGDGAGEVGQLMITNGTLSAVSQWKIGESGGTGTLIVEKGGKATGGSLYIGANGSITTVIVTNGGIVENGGLPVGLTAPCGIIVDGSNSLYSGVQCEVVTNVTFTIRNGGTFQSTGQRMYFNLGSTLINENGIIKPNNNATLGGLRMWGTFQGAGTISRYNASGLCVVSNLNTFIIGNTSTGVVGTLVITNATYQQASNAVLKMDLAGTNTWQYDRLIVSSNMTLAGTCTVSLVSGFVPTWGDRFQLFQWGSVSGAFTTVDLPSLPGRRQWITNDLYTTGEISVNTIPKGVIISAY